MPRDVKRAIRQKPENVRFAGYVEPGKLKEAYCGADAFAFFSQEETEGIVVLEALACQAPVVVRDIPVYRDWLMDGVQVCKAVSLEEFQEKLQMIFSKDCSAQTAAGRKRAEEHGMIPTGMRLNIIYQVESLGRGSKRWRY